MKNYIVEFIGTFFLVLVIGLTVIEPGAGSLAPLAIAAALMVMVYAGGHISGAHYNPAVTLAVWMRGKCDTKDVLPYMASQIVGAILAALCVGFFKSGAAITPAAPDVTTALLVEFLFTFALAYVVLNVATSKKTNLFGPHPRGTISYAADCRMSLLFVRDDRKAPASAVASGCRSMKRASPVPENSTALPTGVSATLGWPSTIVR